MMARRISSGRSRSWCVMVMEGESNAGCMRECMATQDRTRGRKKWGAERFACSSYSRKGVAILDSIHTFENDRRDKLSD